jgi:hypothetical protein
MSYWDLTPEEEEAQAKRIKELQQETCPHSWSIAEVDMNGNVMFTVCKFCRKFHKVNPEGGK